MRHQRRAISLGGGLPLDDLLMFFRGRDISQGDGTPIVSVTDNIGGLVLSQSNSSNRPTFDATEQAIDFSGNSWLYSPTTGLREYGFHLKTSATIFTVVRPDTTPTNGHFFGQVYNAVALALLTESSERVRLYSQTLPLSAAATLLSSAGLTIGEKAIVIGRVRPGTSGDIIRDIFINGALVASLTGVESTGFMNAQAADSISMGKGSTKTGTSAFQYDGKLYDGGIYGHDITDEEVQELNTFLSN